MSNDGQGSRMLVVLLALAAVVAANRLLGDRVEPDRIGRSTLAAAPLPGAPAAATTAPPAARTTQLRIMTINRGRLDAFVEAWRAGVYPLRQKQGFTTEGAWVIRERNEFVWLLSYDGPGTFQARDSAYYASEARRTLDPDPRQYIAKVEAWFLTPVVAPPATPAN